MGTDEISKYQDNRPDRAAHRAALARDRPKAAADFGIVYALTSDIDEVEETWRALEKSGVDSPGQSFDVVKTWIRACGIPRDRQVFVTAYIDEVPLAILPLCSTRRLGMTCLAWFSESHFATHNIVLARKKYGALSAAARARFWSGLLAALPSVDLLYLSGIPQSDDPTFELFGSHGYKLDSEFVYRARFSSWSEIDAACRDRRRRQRDRKQRLTLEAAGKVELRHIVDRVGAKPVLEAMFEQKRRRFQSQGIENPFGRPEVQQFYFDAFDLDQDIRPALYVLYVGEKIAGVRYCLVQGRRLFNLIASMTTDRQLMVASPGHQCLLETLRVAFDEHGIDEFDMGQGESYEKRRWSNEMVPVHTHFIARSMPGHALLLIHASLAKLKFAVKRNKTLFAAYKSIRALSSRLFRGERSKTI